MAWAPAPPKKSKKGLWIGLTAAVAIIALGVGGLFAAGILPLGGEEEGGEVFLLAANEPGPDPFSPTSFSSQIPAEIAPTPTETAPPEGIAGGGTGAVTATSGSTPGLFGGTRDDASCNAQAQADFLLQNPNLAEGWVKALSKDNVTLPDGTPLSLDNFATYLRTLTPALLTADTRVTNHGYRNGDAYGFQAVLQKGTAVLVDQHGTPRARCSCGNPLAEPIPTKTTPKYTGNVWPGFDPNAVTVVQPSTDPIVIFVFVDPNDPAQTVQTSPGTVIINPTPDPVPAGFTRTDNGAFQVDSNGLPAATDTNRVNSRGATCLEFGVRDWASVDNQSQLSVAAQFRSVCDATGTNDSPAEAVDRNKDIWLSNYGGTCDDQARFQAQPYNANGWNGIMATAGGLCVDTNGWTIDDRSVMISATDANGNLVNAYASGPDSDTTLVAHAEQMLTSFARP